MAESADGRAQGAAALGLMLVLVGSAALTALIYVTYCHTAACQRALFALGLAPASLLSATAQVLILAGAWLMWTAARRGRTG